MEAGGVSVSVDVGVSLGAGVGARVDVGDQKGITGSLFVCLVCGVHECGVDVDVGIPS